MAAMLAGCAVIMAALAVGLWNYARAAADTTFDLLLDGAAIAILDSVADTPSGLQVDIPNSALELLGLAKRDRVFYRVPTADGTMLTGHADLPAPPGEGARGARQPRSGSSSMRSTLARPSASSATGRRCRRSAARSTLS
jgi:two-component system sensor histidine kinase TctE